MTTKKDLRQLYQKKRQELSVKEVNRLSDLLLIQFQRLYFEDLCRIHTYLPAPGKKEFDTAQVIDYLHFQHPGLQICVPRIIPGTFEMEHLLTDENTDYAPNAWGIPEPVGNDLIDPQTIDLILVPLLCFDEQGNRVGYGKGFYDRFLQKCRPDAIKVGFSWFPPVARIEDADTFDITLNCCITAATIYEF